MQFVTVLNTTCAIRVFINIAAGNSPRTITKKNCTWKNLRAGRTIHPYLLHTELELTKDCNATKKIQRAQRLWLRWSLSASGTEHSWRRLSLTGRLTCCSWAALPVGSVPLRLPANPYTSSTTSGRVCGSYLKGKGSCAGYTIIKTTPTLVSLRFYKLLSLHACYRYHPLRNEKAVWLTYVERREESRFWIVFAIGFCCVQHGAATTLTLAWTKTMTTDWPRR